MAYRIVAALLVVLLLGLQAGVLAHDAQSTDMSHHQDCVVCHFVSGEEVDVFLPTKLPEFTALINAATATEYSDSHIERFLPTPHGRAPPPRGPPLYHI